MSSTRAPANYSLTIAFPKQLRTAWEDSLQDPGKPIPLASGEVYWDDGTKNTQINPPPQKAPPHQDQRSSSKEVYCHVQLECYLKHGTLMLSGTQVSSTCLESLNALAFTWNDLPPQMDAWLRPLVARREGIRHAEAVKRNEEEDRGLYGFRRNLQRRAEEATLNDSVDDMGHDPNTKIHDNLHTTFSLHYVRFLVASQEDVAWLVKRLGSIVEPTEEASPLTLVVPLTAPLKGGKMNVPFMKNKICSLFGIDLLTTEAVEKNQSDHVCQTSPWVIAF
ncbi:unnamed protein product [Phytomonas sp. Hart1]|nr:unnamed protein product [Phytomonas sp. Hart1]|eukprot:CCW69221.1 unnamed protein product [Phytomonas sp. isolate Hart1]